MIIDDRILHLRKIQANSTSDICVLIATQKALVWEVVLIAGYGGFHRGNINLYAQIYMPSTDKKIYMAFLMRRMPMLGTCL